MGLTGRAGVVPARMRATAGLLAVVAGLVLMPAALAYRPAAPGPMTAEGTVEAVFSPWEDAEGAVVRALEAARTDVYVQAYVFTSRRLAAALEKAHLRGVRVAVLADRDSAASGASTQIPWLISRGIPVWLETDVAIAHNKVMIIDPLLATATVITGSFNWTHAAQRRNAENLLILRGNRSLAQRYLHNWQRHRAQARAPLAGEIRAR